VRAVIVLTAPYGEKTIGEIKENDKRAKVTKSKISIPRHCFKGVFE